MIGNDTGLRREGSSAEKQGSDQVARVSVHRQGGEIFIVRYSETMAAKTKLTRNDLVRRWDDERAERGWWHSFELPDGTLIHGVCDLAGLKNRIAQFPIPQDLRGKRVLDIGAWDGWFSFEMERRGAEVLAIDNWDNPRFHEARALMNSRVEYRQMDMYELTPERVGRFDIVLFMGVLYHLKHPLLALERVCALTTDMAAVDSFILREQHRPGEKVEQRPVMEFYETNEFGGQTDNWVAPSLACLQAFCRTAGFARVELQSVLEHSACLACYRQWEPPAANAPEGPELLAASHNLNGGINFDSSRDELVSAWFRWKGRKLGFDDVRPEVGGYGVRPIHVAQAGEGRMADQLQIAAGVDARLARSSLAHRGQPSGFGATDRGGCSAGGGRGADRGRQRRNHVGEKPARPVARGCTVVVGTRAFQRTWTATI